MRSVKGARASVYTPYGLSTWPREATQLSDLSDSRGTLPTLWLVKMTPPSASQQAHALRGVLKSPRRRRRQGRSALVAALGAYFPLEAPLPVLCQVCGRNNGAAPPRHLKTRPHAPTPVCASPS